MRSVTRSYRIRAYPNGAQRRLLERWFGASRWLWNTTLAIRSEAYRVCGLNLTGVDAGDACPEEDLLVQVLADEARSGQRNRACLEQAGFS
jgi:transposase